VNHINSCSIGFSSLLYEHDKKAQFSACKWIR